MPTPKFRGIQQLSYQNARNQIKTGDILLASGEYPLSRLIRKISDSDFSHVGFIFAWNNRIMLLESVEDDGVRAVPLSHYLYNYENTKRKYEGGIYIGRHTAMPTDQAIINQMLGKAADMLNLKYDKAILQKIMLRIFTGMGRNAQNDEYVCSEFVDECFRQIGIVFPNTGGFISPENIAADPNVQALFEIIP